VAFGLEGLAEGGGEGGDLVERGDALGVEGFVELRGSVGGLVELLHEAGELGEAQTEEGLGERGGGLCRGCQGFGLIIIDIFIEHS